VLVGRSLQVCSLLRVHVKADVVVVVGVKVDFLVGAGVEAAMVIARSFFCCLVFPQFANSDFFTTDLRH